MKCPIKYCHWELFDDDYISTWKHFVYHHTYRQLIDKVLEKKK